MTLNQVLDALNSCGIEYSLAEEYASENEYVIALLQSICDSDGEKNDRFNQANILKMIYCQPNNTEQDLHYAHECLVLSYTAPTSWLFGQKKTVCKNYWKLHIISKVNELFNNYENYGIGFVDGKYVVEWQEWTPSGDRPHAWFGSIPYDNYYDAFMQLKRLAKEDASFEY